MDSKEYLKSLFLQTLDACSPSQVVSDALSVDAGYLHIRDAKFSLYKRPVYVWAAGKASVFMFQSVYRILDGHIAESLVVTPEQTSVAECPADELITASHPLPDERSAAAGKQLIQFIRGIPENALVLSLISGGTSALLARPAGNISVNELSSTFELLNHSGAVIEQMNIVRKHCSDIKGGKLLRYLSSQATLLNLIISDVPGNDPATVGSGPTVADDSAFIDACHVLHRYDLWEKLPQSVRYHLEAGMEKERTERKKKEADAIPELYTWVIGSAEQFARKAAEFAEEDELECKIGDEPFNGSVDTVASEIAGEVAMCSKKNQPVLFLFYGESTVQVTGDGKGGRNQELALHGALKIAGQQGISWLCAGTDGIDGPTDAAGAIIGGDTLKHTREQGLDAESFLENNNSYHFHQQAGTLLKTGPTGNNLMDVVWVLLSDTEFQIRYS